MKRVLIIAYTNYAQDGRVRHHAEALAERGDEVDVICLGYGEHSQSSSVNIIGVPTARYRGASRLSYMRSYVGFFTRAAALAARLSLHHRYDVVMVCTMPDAAVWCATVPKLLGSRVVLDVHDTMPELYLDKFPGRRGSLGAHLLMFEERTSAWMADRVLAVHGLHKQRLAEAGVPANKIRVIMNVPDPRLFHFRCNGHVNGEPFVIACHGTVTRRLGLDVAFRALGLLRDHLPGLQLKVIGNGDYMAQAVEMVAQLQLEPLVTFCGAAPLEVLPNLLEGAAIGLVPNHASSATHLMLPVKLLECAMLGIPVVTARLRTIEHYFGEESVRYFTPDDPAALARAIEDLYHDPERRKALACHAYEVIRRLGRSQQEQYYRAIDSILPKQET